MIKLMSRFGSCSAQPCPAQHCSGSGARGVGATMAQWGGRSPRHLMVFEDQVSVNAPWGVFIVRSSKATKWGGVFECCMCFRIMSNSTIALCGGGEPMPMQVDVGNIPAPSSQGLGPLSKGPRFVRRVRKSFRWSSSLRGSIGGMGLISSWCGRCSDGTCKWIRRGYKVRST